MKAATPKSINKGKVQTRKNNHSSAKVITNTIKLNSSSQKLKTEQKKISNQNEKNKILTNSRSSQYIPIQKAKLQIFDKTLIENSSSNNLMATRNKFNSEKKMKSSMALINRNEMVRNDSLRPFPKVDPEFYSDNHDYLWGNELKRVNTEKNFLEKAQSSNKFLNVQINLFNKSEIFEKETTKHPKYLDTLTKSVSVGRIRDYHSVDRVIPPSEIKEKAYDTFNTKFSNNVKIEESKNMKKNSKLNGVKTVTIDFKTIKNITPMHKKLYESTMQNNKYTPKTEVPNNFHSYEKHDDRYQPITTPSFKKKVEFHKTSYNFLKNYFE